MNGERPLYDARRAALWVAALFVLVPELAAPVPTEAVAEGPEVSVFAGGNSGPGWWTLEIDRTGTLKTSVVGGGEHDTPPRHLTREEQERLLDVLEKLPTEQRKYRFGKSYVDASVDFILRVDTGKAVRQYSLTDVLGEDSARPEVRPILQALHFLRSLVPSKGALLPPPVAGTDSTKQGAVEQ